MNNYVRVLVNMPKGTFHNLEAVLYVPSRKFKWKDTYFGRRIDEFNSDDFSENVRLFDSGFRLFKERFQRLMTPDVEELFIDSKPVSDITRRYSLHDIDNHVNLRSKDPELEAYIDHLTSHMRYIQR